MEKIELSRQELYEWVWNQPMGKLAKKFKIEQHRLREICIENKIPIPNRGYWSKIRFNKKVDKAPLSKIENSESLINLKARKFKSDYHKRAFELEQRNDLKFKVPGKISIYHPLVKTSKKLLEKIDHSENALRFWQVAQEHDLLPIHTDLKLRARAFRLMDTLVRVVEAMGCSMTFYCNSAHVEMFGQKTEINLRQKVYRIRTKDETGWSRESWEGSDKLEFQAGPSFRQKNWIDNTKRKLEECLPEIVAWIEKDCKYWHDLRAEQAIEENKRLLQKQKLTAIKEKEEQEQRKLEQLLIDSDNWNKALILEQYIKEIERQAILQNQMKPRTEDYILWARKAASELNPLNHSDWLK